MNQPAKAVTVRILGKEYQIACPPEEHADLLASAALLDERMRTVRDAGRVVGADRIAVMVALNLAHEMLTVSRQLDRLDQQLPARIDELTLSIEKSLQDYIPQSTDRP